MQLSALLSSFPSASTPVGSTSSGSLPGGSSPAGGAALIGAVLQLKLVESVLTAMHNADAASAHPIGGFDRRPVVSDERCCNLIIRREDRYEPAEVFRPEPRYAPAYVVHQVPRYEEDSAPIHCHASCGPNLPPLPLPPWKIFPLEHPSAARPIIKNVIKPPDRIGKGNLIDLFV